MHRLLQNLYFFNYDNFPLTANKNATFKIKNFTSYQSKHFYYKNLHSKSKD